MERHWTDELGRSWLVEVEVPEDPGEPGDTVLVFGREDADGAEERAMPVLGPLEEYFHELADDLLQHALDATAAGEGLLLVDQDGHLWWVQGGESDTVVSGAAVVFSDGETEHGHGGPLSGRVEDLTEDELLELLDEARGRVMDPMDVTGG